MALGSCFIRQEDQAFTHTKRNNTPSKNSLQAPRRTEEQLLQRSRYERDIGGIPKTIRENPAVNQPMEAQGCQPFFRRLEADEGGVLITDPIGFFPLAR